MQLPTTGVGARGSRLVGVAATEDAGAGAGASAGSGGGSAGALDGEGPGDSFDKYRLLRNWAPAEARQVEMMLTAEPMTGCTLNAVESELPNFCMMVELKALLSGVATATAAH